MKTLLFKTEGSKKIGMGHITRDLDLAKSLNECYDIYFLVKKYQVITDIIRKNGFKTIAFPVDSSKDSKTKLRKLLEKKNFDRIIFDAYNIKQSEINFYRKFCNSLVCFSDETNKLNIQADVVFAFNPNQKEKFYKNTGNGKFYCGLKYFILNPIFSRKNIQKQKKIIRKVLVTLGGSDSNNLTLRVLDNLIKLNYDLEITAILGPGFGKIKQSIINKYFKKGINIKKAVDNMFDEMLNADIGICSAGNTFMEFMSLGIPALVLPQTKREEDIANACLKKGALLKTDNYGIKIKDKDICRLFKRLLSDVELRNRISKNAIKIIDGQGTSRIMGILDCK
ncbi:MAG: UDP-2,4-diacetamido-2,4,6-trideoxy-beta-L-altropyranose hydrolase [Nanoarchaeota archaeon]